MSSPLNKYAVKIKSCYNDEYLHVDVYSVLDAFLVNNQAIGHAVKKLLMAGSRGHKSKEQDLREAIQAINRALHMLGYNKEGA